MHYSFIKLFIKDRVFLILKDKTFIILKDRSSPSFQQYLFL